MCYFTADVTVSMPTGSCRPQLRIIEAVADTNDAYTEVSRDALSVLGFQNYRCCDYSLGIFIIPHTLLSLLK